MARRRLAVRKVQEYECLRSVCGCEGTSKVVLCSAPSVSQSVFKIMFKTLLRHYAKQVLTPQYVDVKLGGRRKSHKGWAGWLA